MWKFVEIITTNSESISRTKRTNVSPIRRVVVQYLVILLGTILVCILITLAILEIKYFWLSKIIKLGGLLIGLRSSFFIDLFNDIDKMNY